MVIVLDPNIKAKFEYISYYVGKLRESHLQDLVPVYSELESHKLLLETFIFGVEIEFKCPISEIHNKSEEQFVNYTKKKQDLWLKENALTLLDKDSPKMKQMKKLLMLQNTLLDELCEKNKCMRSHINLKDGIIDIPSDFDYEKVVSEIKQAL